MTLRSLKKRRIIAPTFKRAIRTSLVVAWTGAGWLGGSSSQAQVPHWSTNASHPHQVVAHPVASGSAAVALRPAPRLGDVPAVTSPHQQPTAHAAAANATREGWNLRWRRSDQVRPAGSLHANSQLAFDGEDVFADEPQVVAVATTSATSLSPESLQQASHTAVVAYQQNNGQLQLPGDGSGDLPSRSDVTSGSAGSDGDFFQDPFSLPDPQGESSSAPVPSDASGMNALRDEALRDDAGSRALEPPRQAAPTPTPPRDAGPSLPDLMREASPTPSRPARDESIQPLPPPANRSETQPSLSDRDFFENPFGDRADEVRRQPDLRRPSDIDPDLADGLQALQDRPSAASLSGITCDDFRDRIARQTIREVSLDISPPFRPDVIDEAEYQELKSTFDEKQVAREWRSIDGRVLAKGRLVDLAYEKVVLESSPGDTQEVAIRELSEPDLAFISRNWGLPMECRIDQVAYSPRSWTSTTMTWKASNLCHKPLYFEEVNLERYGHTAGPVLQPIISSAHFFANIAVLPYKKGIHPPGECQYALGYYRPGNCAPWIVPPVPLSVQGAARQAATMTALFWLIP